jgi:tetratricopeptide (TPR) repeat protein
VRPGTGRHVRVYLGLLASGLLALIGWLAWGEHRSGVLWREARAAAQAGDWDRVEATLSRRDWYRPDDPDAIDLRVEAALRRGDPAAAALVLAAVPDRSPLAGWAHLTRGRLLKELYRPAVAIDELRACLRLDPGQIEAHRQLIVIFGIERRAREQEAQLWAMHDRGGAAVEALRLLAQSNVVITPDALARNSDEGAVLRRCLETTPDDPALPAPLAYFLRNRGRVAEARALLAPWLDSGRGGPDIRLEDLACLRDEGDIESARPWFERPHEAFREEARYWLLRADWLRLQERTREALESDREAVRRDPRDPESRYRLARALRSAGLGREADEAMAYHQSLRRLSELASGISETGPDPNRLVEAARLCRELGRSRESRGWSAAALRVDPKNAEARRFLAETPAADGRPEKRGPKP